MLNRKAILSACGAALIAVPGAAVAHGPTDRGHHGTNPHAHQHDGSGPSSHSRKCTPHRVGYVAAGLLVSHTLVADVVGEGERQTYSGDVVVDVKRTSKHARGDKDTTKTYTLDHARVVLGLDDQNADGVVDLGDVLPGSRVKVIGKVTKLAKRCDQTGFEPELTIRKVIVHAPPVPDES